MSFFQIFHRSIKPFDTGYLPEQDGHQIFYQQFGHPKGEVVLAFHGGPGGASRASQARLFNLKKRRVILFDQRACGRSLYEDAFRKNTITACVSDGMRLLIYLGITGKITVFGSSFGTTCAVLFAETYPQRVKKIILKSVFLGRVQDFKHASPAAALFYPDVVDLFQKQAGQKIEAYYAQLAFSDNLADQKKAFQYYGSFEKQLGALSVAFKAPQELDEKKLLSFRIMMHYVSHKMFLKDNQLLKEASKIAHIPTLIYQNRLDFCCPPSQAFELHQALKKSKLILFADSGHGSDQLNKRIKTDLK